jgi:uncharacterized Tic20 family protein
VFCHLGGFALYVLPFVLGNVLVPLVLWLMKRNESPTWMSTAARR